MIDLEAAYMKNSASNAFTEEPPKTAHDPPPPEAVPSLWAGWKGQAVMAFGVLLPLFAIATSGLCQAGAVWHLTLRHPIETLLQIAFVASVPAANFLVWRSLIRNDGRNPLRMGLLNGFSTGISAIIFTIAAVAICLQYPTHDGSGAPHPATFMGVACFSLLTAMIGGFLCDQLRRSKGTRRARQLSLLFSISGLLFSVCSLAATEARSAYFRYVELLATDDSSEQRQEAFKQLRNMDAELPLRLECADPRTAGLAGLFFHIDSNSLRQLYFGAVGKPYRDGNSTSVASMSDEYLKRHMVGSVTPGLSLIRSAITGTVNSDTFTSHLDWAFVLKNKSFQAEEARAELSIPAGSAISGLTLWINGKPHRAAFGVTGQVQAAYQWVTVSHRDPALLTDLGHGRYLLQCSPVPAQGEMKVSVAISAPLRPHAATEASFTLPRLQDENFAVTAEQKVMIKSNSNMQVGLAGLSLSNHNGTKQLVGSLKPGDVTGSPISIRVGCKTDAPPLVVRDTGIKKYGYIIQQVEKVSANIPHSLVVVIDGSKSMKPHFSDVKAALLSMPENVSATVIVAKDGHSTEPVPMREALEKLTENDFAGGEDNLPAMVKAAEEAGQDKGGAVLWIHGQQPSLNQEMYILAPYNAQPSFYELALDNGSTDANEFFRNHQEIGPFTTIERGGNMRDDLTHFLSGWQPGSFAYKVKHTTAAAKPDFASEAKTPEDADAREISNLRAKAIIDSLLAHGKTDSAAKLAINHRLVTAVTGAVVLENANDYKVFGMTDSNPSTVYDSPSPQSAPLLQGATYGTIGPQTDAAVISGINTASTVRVNNLANLEACLNIFSNLVELLGIAFGGFNIVVGLVGKAMVHPFRLSARSRLLYGIVIIALGLATPGCVNWFVASARDANLFD